MKDLKESICLTLERVFEVMAIIIGLLSVVVGVWLCIHLLLKEHQPSGETTIKADFILLNYKGSGEEGEITIFPADGNSPYKINIKNTKNN